MMKNAERDFSLLGGGDIGFPLIFVASVFAAYGFSDALGSWHRGLHRAAVRLFFANCGSQRQTSAGPAADLSGGFPGIFVNPFCVLK